MHCEEERCNAHVGETKEVSEESEKENEMEEQPVAKRTRNALAKKDPLKVEPVVENKVCFYLGSEDEQTETVIFMTLIFFRLFLPACVIDNF